MNILIFYIQLMYQRRHVKQNFCERKTTDGAHDNVTTYNKTINIKHKQSRQNFVKIGPFYYKFVPGIFSSTF